MVFQQIISKKNLLNLIVLTIPVSYIAGNLILNLNILILLLVSLFIFNKKIFLKKFSNLDKIISTFFLYILLNGLYNNYFNLPEDNGDNIVLLKSIFYLRFLILYFVLKFLISERIVDLKKIFIFYSIIAVFVSADVIFQYFIGYDLFGFEATSRRLSGPFGDEQIAGSFIQRFFIFPLFTLILFTSFKKNRYLDIAIFSTIILISIAILLSGNRMPFLLFSLMLIIFFVFQPEIRKSIIYTFILFVISFVVFFNSNINFKDHYSNLAIESGKISNYIKLKIKGESLLDLKSSYIKEIESGILTWQENKLLGGGVKSFYINCKNINPNKWTLAGGVNCNQHPHNYYLEAAASLGIIGLAFFLMLTFFVIIKSLKHIFFFKNTTNFSALIFPFLVLFIMEIFPLKTTGSLFTTGNATFLFIVIAFIAGLTDYKSKNNTYE